MDLVPLESCSLILFCQVFRYPHRQESLQYEYECGYGYGPRDQFRYGYGYEPRAFFVQGLLGQLVGSRRFAPLTGLSTRSPCSGTGTLSIPVSSVTNGTPKPMVLGFCSHGQRHLSLTCVHRSVLRIKCYLHFHSGGEYRRNTACWEGVRSENRSSFP